MNPIKLVPAATNFTWLSESANRFMFTGNCSKELYWSNCVGRTGTYARTYIRINCRYRTLVTIGPHGPVNLFSDSGF